MWRRDLGPNDSFSSLHADPCDRRRLVLSTAAGAFATLRLDSPSSDRIRYQRFQAEISSGSLRCALPGVRDLLLLVLQRELILFDLEYGQPASSTSLSKSMPAFDSVLGSYGHGVGGKSPLEGGIDVLYCSHVDGSVSVWRRKKDSLEYGMQQHVALSIGALAKNAGLQQQFIGGTNGNGSGGSGGAHSSSSQDQQGVQLVALVAATTPKYSLFEGDDDDEDPYDGEEEDDVLNMMMMSTATTTTTKGPGRIRPQLRRPSPRPSSNTEAQGREEGTPTEWFLRSQKRGNRGSVLLLALASDGSIWRWHFPLLSAGTTTATILPRLVGALHSLSHQITAISAFPGILELPTHSSTSTPKPSATTGVCAVGTAGGTLELVTIQHGRLLPLHLSTASSLHLHPAPVAGVRWLGPTPRIASFSTRTTTTATAEYSNTLVLTDVRSGGSFPFREGGSDRGALAGLRASPSGSYLLLVFNGMPSEIWATPYVSQGGYSPPFRLRQIDLQFTSVEWIIPSVSSSLKEHEMDGKVHRWSQSSSSLFSSSTGVSTTTTTSPKAVPPEEFPAERLVFTLADGRVGVLSVQGRRIQDTKPRMPSWPQLASGEFRATCAASLGSVVFLGGGDGVLVRWDTSSGRTLAVDAGCGHIHGLVVAPVIAGGSGSGNSSTNASASGEAGGSTTNDPFDDAMQYIQQQQQEIAKIAVLASSGTYAVFALDVTGQLRPTAATWVAGTMTAGRVLGIDWVALPGPYGGSGVLAAATESGSLALIDITGAGPGRGGGGRRRRKSMNAATSTLTLAPPPTLSSPLVLPRYVRLLIRILLQRGVAPSLLRDCCSTGHPTFGGGQDQQQQQQNVSSSSSPTSFEARVESELRCALPPGCAATLAGSSRILSPRSPATSNPSPTGGGDAASPSGEVTATGTMAALLQSRGAGLGFDPTESSSYVHGSPIRTTSSSIEEAAMKLGYRGHQTTPPGSGGAVMKHLGGAVKTMAVAGKDQISQRLSGIGRTLSSSGHGHGGEQASYEGGSMEGVGHELPPAFVNTTTASAAAASGDTSVPTMIPISGIINTTATPSSRQSSDYPTATATAAGMGLGMGPSRAGTLSRALAVGAAARGLPCVLSPIEMALYESACAPSPPHHHGTSHRARVAERMVVAAMVAGSPDEVLFWRRLPPTLDSLKNSLSSSSSSNSDTATTNEEEAIQLLWSPGAEMAAATERSSWHGRLSRRMFESSEALQEKRVLEYLSLGDLQGAVGFLLASPPGRSARFYRDALCTLGMAFACGLQQKQQKNSSSTTAPANTQNTASNSGSSNAALLVDEAARTLFVQAAKIVSANAAGVGDTLLGVPLMCATGEFDDAVNILQDAGLWWYAAVLAAGSLSHGTRGAAVERWASHVADAEGRLWVAAGLMVGAGLLGDAADLLMQSGLPDAAAALLEASKEVGLISSTSGPDDLLVTGASPSSKGPGAGLPVLVDAETMLAVNASLETYTMHILRSL